ncbi:rCG44784 [Rattus norvegicus]|uniref:RCG44784 n=1 Tax=Rattus norvegicus TaxID=10116 RepID=A6I5C2_RAT|nr:rCG44784 [Rattus norvegicus]
MDSLPCWSLSVAQFSPSLRCRVALTSVIVHLASHRPLVLKILEILDPCLGCFHKPSLAIYLTIHMYICIYSIKTYSYQRALVLPNVLFQSPEIL